MSIKTKENVIIRYGQATTETNGIALGEVYRQVDEAENVVAEYRWDGSRWRETPIEHVSIATINVDVLHCE